MRETFLIVPFTLTDRAGVAKLLREDQRPSEQLGLYCHQWATGQRRIWVARLGRTVAGYVTVLRSSEYPPLAAAEIPEINDLYVGLRFRRAGVGRSLIAAAETDLTDEGKERVALGIWERGDGVALRLYRSRGYEWWDETRRETPWGPIRYLVKNLGQTDADQGQPEAA